MLMTSSNITRLKCRQAEPSLVHIGATVSRQLITTCPCTKLSNKRSSQFRALFSLQQHTTMFYNFSLPSSPFPVDGREHHHLRHHRHRRPALDGRRLLPDQHHRIAVGSRRRHLFRQRFRRFRRCSKNAQCVQEATRSCR